MFASEIRVWAHNSGFTVYSSISGVALHSLHVKRVTEYNSPIMKQLFCLHDWIAAIEKQVMKPEITGGGETAMRC